MAKISQYPQIQTLTGQELVLMDSAPSVAGTRQTVTASTSTLSGAVASGIGVFTTTRSGVVPASPGGTTSVLRADGAWTTVFDSVGTLGFFPRTAAEIAAGVAPTDYAYAPGNVLRYGADPTGATDSTAGIQSAITALPSSGGVVYFPPSSFTGYKVSSSLKIPSSGFYCRLTGAGYSSIIVMSGAASFDLISWTNPGAGVVAIPYTQIDSLTINGNGLSGTGSLINTQYVSGLRLNDLLLLNIPVTGYGINVVGNGATYSHEVIMRNIQVETSTGVAFVNMSATSSDSSIDGLVGNGNNGCQYGLYINSAAGNNYFNNLHPYGCSANSLYVGATANTSQLFTNSIFDASINDSANLQGSTGITFSNCKFMYAPNSYSCVLLNNAGGNKFNNCTFDSGGTAQYSINETGTSDTNSFDQSTLIGTFTGSPSVNLTGTESSFRVQGTDLILAGAGALTASNTVYVGMGAVNSSEVQVEIPAPYAAIARKLSIQCSAAPGAGQTFTATVRVNGANTAMVATISGAATFSAVQGGFITVPLNNPVSVGVVASSGATTSNIRVSLVLNQ